MSKCGYYLPISTNKNVFYKAPLPHANGNKAFFTTPFFTNSETDSIVKLFLDAVINWRHDDAKAYMSKALICDFTVSDVFDYFNDRTAYKNLVKVEFDDQPKNIKTNSVLVMANDKGVLKQTIIHFNLIKEPDSYSSYKIYSIERE